MNIPTSNCCRCFAPNPKDWFVRRTTAKFGTARMNHKMEVPMCPDCKKHAQIRSVVELGAAFAGVALIFLVIGLIVSIIENNQQGFSALGILAITVFAIIIGIAIPLALVRYFLGKDYMSVVLSPGRVPKVSFTNPDYQALFAQVNRFPGMTRK